MSYGLCSASTTTPSYLVVANSMALSIVGGEKASSGICPASRARITLLRRIADSIAWVGEKVTIARLHQMKRDGEKIVGVVVYDCQMAKIVDRAGVDIVSVGDSIGVNMWGHASEDEVTGEEMLLACRAVTRGVSRALVSCDIPGSVKN